MATLYVRWRALPSSRASTWTMTCTAGNLTAVPSSPPALIQSLFRFPDLVYPSMEVSAVCLLIHGDEIVIFFHDGVVRHYYPDLRV